MSNDVDFWGRESALRVSFARKLASRPWRPSLRAERSNPVASGLALHPGCKCFLCKMLCRFGFLGASPLRGVGLSAPIATQFPLQSLARLTAACSCQTAAIRPAKHLGTAVIASPNGRGNPARRPPWGQAPCGRHCERAWKSPPAGAGGLFGGTGSDPVPPVFTGYECAGGHVWVKWQN
jgi:hypothetical protein